MARYHYREGVTLEKKRGRWFLIFIAIIVFAAAAYVATIYIAPQLVTVPFTSVTPDSVAQKVHNSKAGELGDRLFLSQINVDVPLTVGGQKDALNYGAWQRNAGLGSPDVGGHVVLSGYKFTWDMSPLWAREKSPFYNLSKINVGDDITLDYKGARYVYKVDKKQDVANGESLEQKSDDDRLTLYATDSSGDATSGVAVSGVLISPIKQFGDR